MNTFEELKTNYLSGAAKMLERMETEKVKAFKLNIKDKRTWEQAEKLLEDIHQGGSFNKKWRKIFVDIVDVDLQIFRLRNCLILLKPTTSAALPLGQWVDYNYVAWALLAQGLIYRTEKLVKDITREFIRQVNPNWKNIEGRILINLEKYKSALKSVRDPIAHTGGAVEALDEGNHAERVILVGGFKAEAIFLQMGDYREKWYKVLYERSNWLLAEIMKVCASVNNEINWEKY